MPMLTLVMGTGLACWRPHACRVRTFSGVEPRQARLLRRQAQLLAETLLATVEAGLDSLELDGAGTNLSQVARQAQQQQGGQQAPQVVQQVQHKSGRAPMQTDAAAAAELHAQLAEAAAAQLEEAHQDQGSPGSAQQAAGEAAAGASSASPPPAGAAPPVAQTPAAAVGASGGRTTTPGTDLRAVLGTPAGPLPSADQSQLQERGMALLQVAHAFHKDISRWLQVHGTYGCVFMVTCRWLASQHLGPAAAPCVLDFCSNRRNVYGCVQVAGATAAGNSGSSVRDELRAVGRSCEQGMLR